MNARFWARAAIVVVAAATALPEPAAAQMGRGRGRGQLESRTWDNTAVQNAYERGLREGLTLGAADGRGGRASDVETHIVYRDGDRGYQSRYGSREAYRDAFRRGFASGYREGYDRYRNTVRQNRDDRTFGRAPRGYQEPAYARGYSDGYQRGVEDGRDRDRYDPVRHEDYREADQGYHDGYGSKDAYRTNYRAGFRPGYEEGYREGGRRR